MNQSTPKISGALRLGALGATFAMLPLTIYIIFLLLEIVKRPDDDTAKLLVVFQLIGCLMWAAGLTGAVSEGKRLKIPASGFGLCIAGIMIGGILQLIFTFDEKLLLKFASLADGEGSGLVLSLMISLIVHLPIIFGIFSLGNHLRALNKAKVPYILLSVFPLITYIISKIAVSSHSLSTLRILIYILGILFVVCVITAIIAWWGIPSDAKEIEEDAENDEGDFAPQPTYVEQTVAAPDNTPATAHQSRPLQPVSSITDQQKKMLMGMTDKELTNVVNNPALYANPSFVDEARKTLTKRQGWEVIKDFTDDQLLSVVHENIQGFSAEVLDAASMELLARETPAFINEITSLSIEELQGILSNADSYYDGYVQLATRTLNQRLNPGNNPVQ